MKYFLLRSFIGFLFLSTLSAQVRSYRTAEYIDGEVLVKFKDNVQTTSAKKAIIASLGDSGFSKIKGSNFVTVKTSLTNNIEEVLKKYKNNPNVEIAQPNYVYKISSAPNDTYYPSDSSVSPYLWGLKNTGQTIPSSLDSSSTTNNPGTAGADINVEPAWTKITDCSSVVVAIIDTGVNYQHRDLASNMWDGGLAYPKHGYDFVDNDNDPMDFNGHGTHLAGVIGAVGNNATDGVGVCWKSNIMAIRAFDENGSASTTDIVQGIDFAINNHAKIINMSFGVNAYDAIIGASITSAEQAGLLVVAAAGNDGINMSLGIKTYPCSYTNSNIICVAALDQKDGLTSFSNYGYTEVDVAAPGFNIYSSWFGDELTGEDFNPCWTNLTGSTGSWACPSITINGSARKVLASPSTWNGANNYVNNSDKGIYQSYSIDNTCSYVSLSFDAFIDLEQSVDFLNIYYTNGGNPMSTGVYQFLSSAQTLPLQAAAYSYSLPNCVGQANCSVGFLLSSNASVTRTGASIIAFRIYGIKNPTSEYRIEHGTSMATPYVVGLAAMLMAYNPSYTYADVKNSILNGGRAISDLSTKTVSGNSIDAWGSLTYINAPSGVAASVQ